MVVWQARFLHEEGRGTLAEYHATKAKAEAALKNAEVGGEVIKIPINGRNGAVSALNDATGYGSS